MNKKIIFVGLVFVLFVGVAFTANAATTTPTIKIISPNGGEVWKAGTTKNIKFKGNLIKEPVSISLLWGTRSNGIFVGESITSGNGKPSTYSWTIPMAIEERSDYEILVGYKSVEISDSNDKVFTIKNTIKNKKPSNSSSSKSTSSSKSKSSSSSATTTKIYILKVNKSGKGYVSVEDNRITCGKNCEGVYKDGDTVKITAVPDGGYVFKKFAPEKECSSIYSDGFGLNDNKLIKQAFAYRKAENVVCVTIMKKNKTITAVFEKIKK